MSRSGIFGWSYPPGCSGPPDDGPEPPCQMCGELEGKCKCPECTVKVQDHDGAFRECGTVGCLEHMPIQSLVMQLEHHEYLAHVRQQELQRRELAEGPKCEYCGTQCRADLREGSPAYCDKCHNLALKSEREPDSWDEETYGVSGPKFKE